MSKRTFVIILIVVGVLGAFGIFVASMRPKDMNRPKVLQVLTHSEYPAMREPIFLLGFSGFGLTCLNDEKKGGTVFIVYDFNDMTETVFFDEGFNGTLDRVYKVSEEKGYGGRIVYDRSLRDDLRPEWPEFEKQYLTERQKATEGN